MNPDVIEQLARIREGEMLSEASAIRAERSAAGRAHGLRGRLAGGGRGRGRAWATEWPGPAEGRRTLLGTGR